MAASHLNRLTREHALLMTCACAAVLLLSFPSTIGNWTSLNLSSVNSSPNESEIDSALQQAATASLGQREGAIIVMDAQTGRIRA